MLVPLEMIKKHKVAEEVCQQMKDMIASGEWRPGDKLPAEPALAEMFGVSRLSIRDVLQQLASLGIVERTQGKGTFVCRYDGSQVMNGMLPIIMLDDTEIETMFEFRGMLECESSRLAAIRADEADIERLRSLTEQLEHMSPCPKSEAECDFEFHMAIVKATGNKMLIRLYELLRQSVVNSLITVKERIGSESGLQDHHQLVEAIAAHDQQKARDVMWKHMDRSLERYRQAVDE